MVVQRKLLRCQEGTTAQGKTWTSAMFHLALWVALSFSFSLLQCPAVLSVMPLGILLGRVVSSRLFPTASLPSSLDHPGSLHPCLFSPLSYVFAGIHVGCICVGVRACHPVMFAPGSLRRVSQSSPELAAGQLLWRSSSTSETGTAGGCHTHLVLLHFHTCGTRVVTTPQPPASFWFVGQCFNHRWVVFLSLFPTKIFNSTVI